MIRTAPIDVRAALQRLIAWQTSGMRLTPEQKRRYMLASSPARLQHFLSTSVVGIAMFNLFLITDWYMMRDVFDLAVKIRLGVLTPAVLLLVIGGHMARDWWLKHTAPWGTEIVAMVGTMSVSAALGVLLMTTGSDQLSLYRIGLVPILMFGNVVQRLPFGFALASSLFNLGVYAVSMAVRHDLVTPYKMVEVPLAVLLALVALYSLISNFNLEMDERQSFLQTERATKLRDELEQSNLNLHNMSLQDPLTGLANRRRFDAFVTALFERAPHATLSLGVWLVDVDHFKAFNDRYGHPAGDQCLRQVAQALSAALPPEHGLLARWGGEEFAVVLPDADQARCQAVGEALRRSVELLSMRHEASSTAPHVTISAGGALSASCRCIQDVEALLKLADEGLYQAKAQGRNRWAMAEASVAA